MHDVALVAGVSHQTVSRVVNGSSGIRPDTRARVKAAIEQLGYRQNLAARILATRRTFAMGIVVPGVSDYGPTTTLYAVEASARKLGFRPLITTTASDPSSLLTAVNLLLAQGVEGIVMISPHVWARDLTSQIRHDFPTVSVHVADVKSSVSTDQAVGVELALAHLTQLGHIRFQHLGGPDAYVESVERANAFKALADGMGACRGAAVSGDWSAASGFAAASLIDDETSAVFCANDQMALGLIAGLRQAGRAVPRDVSVVGYDDIPEAAYFGPGLTTIRQDFDSMGKQAAELLALAIENPTLRESRVLVPRLIVRGSTGPVRDHA